MSAILATALVGSLFSAGVALNKSGRQPREILDERNAVDADEQPNQRNAYHSERYYDTWNDEFARATKAHLQAQDTKNENVVPLYYNQMSLRQQQSPELQNYALKRTPRIAGLMADKNHQTFINEGGNEVGVAESPMFRPLGFGLGTEGGISNNAATVEQFDVANRAQYEQNGALSKEEHFQSYTVHGPANSNNPDLHNNMVPFYGARVRQNTDPEAWQNKLEHFTGQTGDVTEFRAQPHREIPSLQDRTPGQTFVYGAPASLANIQDRYITSNFKENVTPFQQIRVGPGISPDTYEAAPRDGFHPYYRPTKKTVDDLRVNPKNTYEGRLLPGQEQVQNRGFCGEVFKQRPDRFTPLNPDRWNRTTGSFTAPMIRQNFCPDLKCQERSSTNIEYVGPAGNRENLGSRPGVYVEGSDIDNGGACVGGELCVDGRIADDNRDGTLYGGIPYKERGRASDDLLRSAPGDGLIEGFDGGSCLGEGGTGGVCTGELDSGAGCTLSARVQHTLRNHLRAEPFRNVGSQAGVYEQTTRPYDKMRANTRDTTHVRDYIGQAFAGDLEGQTVRPYDKMRANTRDTTHVRDYVGQVQSTDQEKFTTRPYDKARANIRDTTHVRDYVGQIQSSDQEKFTTRPYDKARANIRDTTHVRDYVGQVQSSDQEKFITRPYDKARANMRDTTHVRDYMGQSSAKGDNLKPRKYLDDKVRMNTRALTNVRDYVGVAGSVQTRQPRSYESMYNATSNNNMESLLEGRTYGPNKATNITNGACDVNMQIRARTGYDITRYGPNETRLYSAIPSMDNSFDSTTSRNQRGMPGARQPEDFAVDQFSRNPYSQSLHSSTPMTSIERRGETPFTTPECVPDRMGVSTASREPECLGGATLN